MSSSKSFKVRLHYQILIFGFLLFVLAFAMATAIFLKQRMVTPGLEYHDAVLWQLALWIPLVLLIPCLNWVLGKYSKPIIWMGFILLFIGLHYAWFVGMSTWISPYRFYPRTRYGVYPFFFIFWTLIDIFLVSGLVLFLISQNKKKKDSEGLTESLYVKKGNKGILLKPEEILWIGADDYYSDIHSTQGRFLERKPLKVLLEHLPEESFVRIHRSTVVNLHAIRKFHPISGLKAEVELKDGNIRTVSRTYLKSLKDQLARAKA